MPAVVNGQAQLVGPDGRPIPPTEGGGRNGSGLPHVYTFSGLYNTTSRLYSWRWDEAYARSREDALSMRRDIALMGMLRERQYPTEQMAWHLEPDDQQNAEQVAAADELAGIIRAIPHLEQVFRDQLEALWYGRAGTQFQWEPIDVNGREVLSIVKHWPVNGDKIQFDWDGTAGVLVHAGSRPEMDATGATLKTGDRGLTLMLDTPYWQQRFCIHKHECIDADFFEADKSGGVHGVGIRHWCYWYWWLRSEILSWVMDFLERTGLGLTIIYYDESNPQSEAKAKEAGRQVGKNTVLLVPRVGGQKKDTGGNSVEHIETTTSGSDIILRVIEYLDSKLERFIVGQTLSSRPAEGGLGGTGEASFQQDTKYRIIRGDCTNLANTLTHGLVKPLQRFNQPAARFNLRWVFNLDDPNAPKKLQAAKTVFDMGVSLVADEVRGMAGLSKPERDDEVVGKPDPPELAAAKGAPGANGSGDGQATADEEPAYFSRDSHRGQPDNAGQFGPGGGVKKAKSARKVNGKGGEGTGNKPPAAKPPAERPTPATTGPQAAKKSFGKSKAKVSLADDVEKALPRIFGKKVKVDDIASLVGALDDAEVSVSKITDKAELKVEVKHEAYTASRRISKTKSGTVIIHNDEFWMKPEYQKSGLGANVFARQVESAAEAGVSSIRCHAAKLNPRAPLKPHNGYYTWPRFGYDQSIDDLEREGGEWSDEEMAKEVKECAKAVRKNFPEAESILDVMDSKEGRDWWKTNGCDLGMMKFDLDEGSRSRRVFDDYLAVRGSKVEEKAGAKNYGRDDDDASSGGVEEIHLSDEQEEALNESWAKRDGYGSRGDDDGDDNSGGSPATRFERTEEPSQYAAWQESLHPRDDIGQWTEKATSALQSIPLGELSRVSGFLVRRTADDEYRIETEHGAGSVRGNADKIRQHIARVETAQRAYGKQLHRALDRAAAWEEPGFMDAAAQDAAARAFAALPAGTPVVSLEEATHGRTGRIVRDDAGRNRVKLEGEDGYASNHVEPLDEKLSWRVKPEDRPAAAPRLTQQTMFERQSLAVHYAAGDDCNWITIGGEEGEDGKRHGGSPVCVKGGRIVKGHPSLTGKKIDALDEAAEPTGHRKELNQSKGYSRAVWAKKARAEGIDPQHVHQLTAEALAHDAAHKGERTAMLKRARTLSENLGHGGLGTIAARHAGGKIDASHVRGLDDTAAALAEEFPGFSGDPDELYDMLVRGNPTAMSEDEAYEWALEHLRGEKTVTASVGAGKGSAPEKGKGKKHVKYKDAVPFERDEQPADYAAYVESDHPRAPDGTWTDKAGGGGPGSHPAGETSSAPAAPAAPQDLKAFADDVVSVAKASASGWFHNNKVFISHVYRQFARLPGNDSYSLDTFKQRLLEANRQGLLHLSRADLVAAMDPHAVKASEITIPGSSEYSPTAQFHFVTLDVPHDWQPPGTQARAKHEKAAAEPAPAQQPTALPTPAQLENAADAATRFRDLLQEIDTGTVGTAKVEALLSDVATLSKPDLDELLVNLNIAGRAPSKKAAIQQIRSVLNQQLEARQKSHQWGKDREEGAVPFERSDAPENYAKSAFIHIVDRYNDDGSFAGHKVLFGHADAAAAKAAYLAIASGASAAGAVGGVSDFGCITAMTEAEFDAWLEKRDPKRPAWEQSSDDGGESENAAATPSAEPATPAPAQAVSPESLEKEATSDEHL